MLDKHQEEAIEACFSALFIDGCQKQLVQMATGGGKTKFAAAFASRFLQPGQRLLFLAHRDLLLKQAIREFSAYFPGQTLGMVQGPHNQYKQQHIFATAQTIQNPDRLQLILSSGPISLLIVDECHRALAPSWLKIIQKTMNEETVLLGLTATPMRSDRQSLKKLFDECVYSISILDLIAMEPPRLCDLRRIKIVVPDLHLKDAKRGEDGDFTQDALDEAVAKSRLRHKLAVEAILRYAKDEHGPWPGLFFGANVQDTNEFAKLANAAGIPTAVITGKTTNKERKDIIEGMKSGSIQVIANVGVFTEGVDIPLVRFVVMGRHTTSQGLYIQMAGRACRLLDGEREMPFAQRQKKEALIIDLCDNEHSVLVLADMVGTTDEKMGNRSVRELIKDKEIRVSEPIEVKYKPGSMAVHVMADSVFTTRNWEPLGYDKKMWSCTSKGLGIAYVEHDFAGYDSYFVSTTGQKTHLNKMAYAKIEHAFGAAELFLKAHEQKAQRREQARSDMGFRALPARPDQIARLKRARFPIAANAHLTQGQVQDYWDQLKDAGSLKDWYAKYFHHKKSSHSSSSASSSRKTIPSKRVAKDDRVFE